VGARVLDPGRRLLGERFDSLLALARRSSNSMRTGLATACPIRANWAYRGSLSSRWAMGLLR
jgi:hypothetical protein